MMTALQQCTEHEWVRQHKHEWGIVRAGDAGVSIALQRHSQQNEAHHPALCGSTYSAAPEKEGQKRVIVQPQNSVARALLLRNRTWDGASKELTGVAVLRNEGIHGGASRPVGRHAALAVLLCAAADAKTVRLDVILLRRFTR